MKQPRISIITPVYNAENYLLECINSVKNQTYTEWEMICVNDGSTDASSEILSKAAEAEPRIRIINQLNSGLSGARNRGMREATGDYIMFLDSDDWIDRETCETAAEKIREYDADVVFWSYMREYPGKSIKTALFEDKELVWKSDHINILFRKMVGLTGRELANPQKTDNLITVWGKLYKKSVLSDIEFTDTKEIGTEDALFNIQVFSKVRCAVYVPSYFSHYRKSNATSLTHQYKNNLAGQWRELYRRILQILRTGERNKECLTALNNRICLGLIGLGLNLAEDRKMSHCEKIKELRRILHMPHYKKALTAFSLNYLPIQWKVFFFCAKRKCCLFLYGILLVINQLRSRV